MKSNLNPINYVFFGTAPIAARLLEHLIENGLVPRYVISQPDAPTGRKKKLAPTPVKEMAVRYGLDVVQPEKIRDFAQTFTREPLDLVITCAYGQILPKDFLEHPAHGALNLHGSLLPAWRGGAPVQRALWNGDEISGVSLMQMDEGMDSGPVYATRAFELEGLNTQQVFERMADEGAGLILEWLPEIVSGQARPVPQDPALASYAPILKPHEERLDLDQPARKLLGQVRAFAPVPGVFVRVQGKKLKILEASYLDEPLDRGLFRLENKKLFLGTGPGRLQLERVQLEGKKAMEARDFINGSGKSLDGKEVE